MITDEVLAEQALNGDLSAFEELVNRYKKSVFAIVYRMVGQYQEAEDISQEVFILVYEKLYQFDRRKKFGPWIHRIAVNTTISALRKKKKVISISFDDSYGKPYHEYPGFYKADPQLMFERQELADEINSAISELSDNYRTVLILRYQLDLTNQEIADTLGITRENIEVRVHRARKALRRELQKKWQERGVSDELSIGR
ncbi:RNA polymerase sigma factor [Syntrophomonas erecta subsp. sporosyntropha]